MGRTPRPIRRFSPRVGDTFGDMYPRSLKALVQVPRRQRFDVVAEGLQVLIEHVTVLTDELDRATKAGCARIVPALQAQSEEESAKVLILLDLVRAG
jgi:hypothetical protein